MRNICTANPKMRLAQAEIHFARKHASTAKRATCDPQFADAMAADLADTQRELDTAVMQMWFAQRP